jgi:hypothetical protein
MGYFVSWSRVCCQPAVSVSYEEKATYLSRILGSEWEGVVGGQGGRVPLVIGAGKAPGDAWATGLGMGEGGIMDMGPSPVY